VTFHSTTGILAISWQQDKENQKSKSLNIRLGHSWFKLKFKEAPRIE
jgi:hypothetical protein